MQSAIQPKRLDAGFVLVTSLLILVVLSGLAAGAFFLTNTNLRIAENTRTSAVAQYNAYEGLDVALIALAREYRERADGTWPSLAELRARMPADGDYTIDALQYDSPVDGLVRGGVVAVEGNGPRGARYPTSARFEGASSTFEVEAEANPIFGVGWVTEAGIAVKGNATVRVGLWASGSISGSGKAQTVTGSGNFAKAGGDCNINTDTKAGVSCISGLPSYELPDIPDFSFNDGLIELAREAGLSVSDGPDAYGRVSAACESAVTSGMNVQIVRSNGQVAASPGRTYCVEPGVTLRLSGTATGVYVLGAPNATVRMQSVGSVPLSTSLEPDVPARERVGIKVAAGTVETGSGTLRGENTLYAVNGFLAYGQRSEEIQPGVVSTLVATEGSVKTGDEPDIAGIFWANGHFCKQGNGGANFRGTILVKGQGATPSGPCTRGIYWNGGGGGTFTSIVNTNIPDDDDGLAPLFEAAGIRILMKRP